jgi:3-hydroxyisobutyrate dehydrogenase
MLTVQGIITSMARLLNFPTPLCSIAEQAYMTAIDKGFGSHDDAGLIRLWTSDPVSSIESTLSESEKQEKLALVTDLLAAIHLTAAAESITFAKHVGLPLPQLYELAVEAAGGSTMFKEFGAKMIPVLEGKESGDAKVLESYLVGLKKAVEAAQAIRCPLYLGSGALNLLLQTGKSLDLASLLKLYSGN